AVDDASRQTASAPALASKVTAHEFELPPTGAVRVLDDDRVTVSATRVFHGDDVPNACGYRFDIKSGGSVVFSGDTYEPDDNLIALMAGADPLVHEAMSVAGATSIHGHGPAGQPAALMRHLPQPHTARLPPSACATPRKPTA